MFLVALQSYLKYLNISDFQSMFDVPEKCIQQVQLQIPVPVGATVGFEVVNHTIQSQVASCCCERKGAKELQGYPKNPHRLIGSVTWSYICRLEKSTHLRAGNSSFGIEMLGPWMCLINSLVIFYVRLGIPR